jgi:hypothetical protein
MFVVRLIDSDITPKAFDIVARAEAFAKGAVANGEAERAEIYEIEGAKNAADAMSRFNAGQRLLWRPMSRLLTPDEARNAAKAEEQCWILDRL